jgi:putative SOS response-associated peptidase YedK
MCGRYVSVKSRPDLIDEYNAARAEGPELRESYNVAPQTLIYAVLDRAEPEHPDHVERQVHSVRWGLVPSWSKDPKIGNKLVNARVETLSSKPSWRSAYRKHRCVIPSAGYLRVAAGGARRQGRQTALLHAS